MRAFVITTVILLGLTAGIALGQATGDHPRKRPDTSFGDDLFAAVLAGGLAAWGLWILLR